jgi:hypothetical protein
MGYAWSEDHGGMRTAYRLHEGVAQRISELHAGEESDAA